MKCYFPSETDLE